MPRSRSNSVQARGRWRPRQLAPATFHLFFFNVQGIKWGVLSGRKKPRRGGGRRGGRLTGGPCSDSGDARRAPVAGCHAVSARLAPHLLAGLERVALVQCRNLCDAGCRLNAAGDGIAVISGRLPQRVSRRLPVGPCARIRSGLLLRFTHHAKHVVGPLGKRLVTLV